MKAPKISQDISVILISIIGAVYIAESGIIHDLVYNFPANNYLASFFAGIFFTSIFTTAPSIVILGELAKEGSIISVAMFGAIGAVVGDYIIFRFFKDRFAEDIRELFSCKFRRKVSLILQKKIFRFITPVIGAFIIASPFPDEFGIMLLSISKIKSTLFLPISYTFNYIGIILIGYIASSI